MTNVEPVKIPEGYKQTEVGVIPNEWDMENLSRYVEDSRLPSGLYKEQTLYGRGTKIIKLGDVFKFDKFNPNVAQRAELTSEEKRSYSVSVGDIFIALASVKLEGVGKVMLVDELDEITVYDHNVALIRPRQKCNPKYLFYILKSSSIRTQVKMNATQVGTSFLKASTILGFSIPMPALEEQTAIANALSDVDNLIASLETLIAKKSAIKTAAMQQLLTGKKRLPAFVKESEKQGAKQSSELDNTSETAQTVQTKQTSTLNSDLYKESGEGLDSKLNQLSEVSNANNKQTAPRPGYKQTELGEIPEDWEIRALDSLCTIMTGSTPATNTPAYYGEEFMFASPADLKGQKYVSNTIKNLSAKGFNISRKYPKNSVLFTCIGSTIGKCGVATQEMTSNQQINAVLPSDEIEENYLYYQLVYTAPQVKQQAGEQAVPLVNKTQFGEHTVYVPSDKQEQIAIANVLSDMDTELDSLQQRLSKTQKIKQGMMQELLTGKTRLV